MEKPPIFNPASLASAELCDAKPACLICEDSGMATLADVCEACAPSSPIDVDAIIALLEAGLAAHGEREMRACIHAALDYARNDQEALAEGRLWANSPSPAAPLNEFEPAPTP